MFAMKSASKLALLALLKDNAYLAAGAPSCHRVASQWTMVFTEECTSWFSKGHSKANGIPTACEQNFTGGVAVDTFPRNNKVVVMDNKRATDTFDLQPSQEVAQQGAGVVIVQTTRDMTEDRKWHARNGGVMAKMVHPRVDYLAARDEKYVDIEVHVNYAPRHKKVPKNLGHGDDVSTYSYDYSDAYLVDDEDNQVDLWLSEGMPDKGGVGRYKHPYDYSHDYSYDFSFYHSYDFSFEFGEGAPREPHYVRTATSLDVYVCSDEHEDQEEEKNFYCDPIHGGTEQCYAEANPADVRSLTNRHMKMYCEPQCLSGGSGGLWCDIFGLDGCRMCTEDCSAHCEGNDDCHCFQCGNRGPGRRHPRPSTTPQPTTTVTPSPNAVGIPLMSAAPTPGSWPGIPVECTPGDDDSCYSQLSTFESANLERRSRGLTCEESCITGGGLWCDALGLEGCRFCAYSCEEFCAKNGMPENCECIEC